EIRWVFGVRLREGISAGEIDVAGQRMNGRQVTQECLERRVRLREVRTVIGTAGPGFQLAVQDTRVESLVRRLGDVVSKIHIRLQALNERQSVARLQIADAAVGTTLILRHRE